MPRRATPPRERILAAAHTEFAARGLAGARIDSIAREAEASKERLYAHFATKRDLFDAALGESIDRWLSAIPFDAHDLPGWASRLYEHLATHADDARLLLWGQIEGASLPSPGVVDHDQLEARREAVRQAQESGEVNARWDADELLTMLFGLVLAWFVTPDATNLHVGPDERRRDVVEQAVRQLVATVEVPGA
ncbi:TetR family transcriptional regulator [Frigoribacterium sp. 2-23]|uniref:TetR family transcriptional regulator n=1 Tax=Frigoribacterium sp. 2-23 TaxID=3415006 RepID=UPI003C6F6748